jgi:hypothetical protein
VAVMKEVFRVLKPGAKFSYLDWVLLDNYDPENEVHVDHIKVSYSRFLQYGVHWFDCFTFVTNNTRMYVAHHALHWSRR